MKRLVILVLIAFSNFCFSQEQKMSYYFDTVVVGDLKNYPDSFIGKTISFYNKKDTTYVLLIRCNDKIKDASLSDFKKKFLINFNVNFDFEKIEDLSKLNAVKLYKNVDFSKPKKNKNYVENFEYEKDSLTGKTIVHLTQYKNNKLKKIINEHYYFFGNSFKNYNSNKIQIKSYLIKKYNFNLIADDNLEKSLCIINGKISNDFNVLDIKDVNYNFEFKIDEIYPIQHNTSTIIMN